MYQGLIALCNICWTCVAFGRTTTVYRTSTFELLYVNPSCDLPYVNSVAQRHTLLYCVDNTKLGYLIEFFIVFIIQRHYLILLYSINYANCAVYVL